ncbi:hypothetical protein [Streptomyces sp. NPDC005828]|uniref:hypothetical protein n=1 Tax=Streptomyces sp. NPDC005828 TaxID=3157071 RepID=UPI0033D7609F
MPYFKAVLFDWVGTLVVPQWGPIAGRPKGAHWIERTLPGLGRDAPDAETRRISEALMVGDRSGHDGGGVEAGLATLLLPPLTDTAEERLHLVLGACGLAAGAGASR